MDDLGQPQPGAPDRTDPIQSGAEAPGTSLQKEALRAIDALQTRIAEMERARTEPIAIVGIGCRFPGGADDADSYWRLLIDGVDAVGPVPPGRWDTEALYDADPDAPGKLYVREGGFLSDIETFDADFFGISAREAVSLDPQQRLLLETTWEALEHAGIPPDSLRETKTGVYVGVMENDYAKLHLRDGGAENLDAYYVTGNHFSFNAGRISYVLGLRGPAVVLDTACSSSLVAIDLACRGLRSRETDVALAGGVNVMLSPELTITMCKFHALAPDGRCKTFDASADGFGQGEGCGMIVLKRLSDAIAGDDHVIAVIRGSAVNHDGPSGGLTVPSAAAQRMVVAEALENAGVDPSAVGYVEAHGTGTSLGDPIELRALGEAFSARRGEQPLVVGSVKTNIGHLESAAGVAGLIKVALALRHKRIPPHLHLTELNPRISLDELGMAVPTRAMEWPADHGPRAAGVSSFGLSGTNAHIVLEEAPVRVGTGEATPSGTEPDVVVRVGEMASPRRPHLLVVSAGSVEALKAQASRYADALSVADDAAVADMLWLAANGRAHLEHRLAVVANGSEELVDRLRAFAVDEQTDGVRSGLRGDASDGIAFLFTGQGAQYVGMGRLLYDREPVFRSSIDACDEIIRERRDVSLREVMFDDPSDDPLVDRTEWTQPALFALEYALVQLWQSWGVEPSVVLGHSVGEYAAACAAGVFDLRDGLGLIAERGRLMGALPRTGSMAVVFAPLERVQEAIGADGDRVQAATINAPAIIVISGEIAAVDRVTERLSASGVKCRALNVSHAFHSPLMDPMLDEFEKIAAGATFRPPRVPFVSNLTGQLAGSDRPLDARYWRDHVRQPVRFSDGIAALYAQGQRTFLEVGPSPTLLGMARKGMPADEALRLISSLRGAEGDPSMHVLEALAELWIGGHPIDWRAFHGDRPGVRQRVSLPTYPFQRERYWLEARPRRPRTTAATEGAHPLLGIRVSSPLKQVQFEAWATVDAVPYLTDHRVAGTVIMPLTAMIDMGLRAAGPLQPDTARDLVDIAIHEALLIKDGDEGRLLQSILDPGLDDGEAGFRLTSLGDDGEWTTHLTARVRRAGGTRGGGVVDLAAARARCSAPLDVHALYERLREVGLEYGPAFRGITGLWRGDREVLGQIRPPVASPETGEAPDPTVVDAALQLVHALAADESDSTVLPVGIDRVSVHGPIPEQPWAHLRVRPQETPDPAELLTDVRLCDAEGRIAVEVDGFRVRRASAAALQRLARPRLEDWFYEVNWQEVPPPARAPSSRGAWVIVDEGDHLAPRLRPALEALGHSVSHISRAGSSRSHPLDLRDPEDARRALAPFRDGKEPLAGVLYVAPPDGEAPDVDVAVVPLHLIQALDGVPGRPRLVMATRGAQPVGPDPAVVTPAHGAVWGLGAVASSERREIHCVRIDLDPWPEADQDGGDGDPEVEALVREMASPVEETQIAYRRGQRYAARLGQGRSGDTPDGSLQTPDGPFRLIVASPGHLDSLTPVATERPEPGPGQIEIEVRSTGLNFKDVLKALGRYPLAESPLGDECAGVVTAVGPGVDRLAPGDRVVAMAYGSFRSHVLTPAAWAVAVPDDIPLRDIAGLPIAYLTASHALSSLGELEAGQRVFIHSATGGVGLWAVEIAKRVGADVYASAGSPRKRAFLRAMGVEHVYDSRSLAFSDEVLRDTGGEGVDLVLNSLAGEYIPETLRVVRRGGRFVEIGRTGVWTTEQVAEARPDVGYHVFYLGDLAEAEPDRIAGMMNQGLAALQAGELTHPPVRAYSLDRLQDAFRYMSQSRHIGKIVVTQPARPASGDGISAEGTYVVTGGLGGIGLEVARWLVDQGAGTLVLVGRSGARGDAATAVDELRLAGARVEVRAVDVSDADSVAALGREIAEDMPPLRGIMHAAAILDDGLLIGQTRERFERVFAPKATGAWHLHEMSRGAELDFFVLFSSWAALVGLPGQGNYVAANAYLDALSNHRRGLGLPSLSINWGAWGEVGMAASMAEADRKRLADMGVTAFDPELGTLALGRLLRGDGAQAAVLAIDWGRWFEYQTWSRDTPFFAELAERVGRYSPSADAAIRGDLAGGDPDERRHVIQTRLLAMAAKVMRVPASKVDPSRNLDDLGLDSLMYTELLAAIDRDFGVALPLSALGDQPTVAAITETVAAALPDEVGEVGEEALPGNDWPEPEEDALPAPEPKESRSLFGWLGDLARRGGGGPD